MEEVISLHGKQFQIWYDRAEERVNALKAAESMCPSCGLGVKSQDNQSKENVQSLAQAASCANPINKTVGDQITLSSNPTSGTFPYNYSFYKVLPGTSNYVWIGAQNQPANFVFYRTLPEDVTTNAGNLKVGVIVNDSCPNGSLSSEEWCYVNVTAPQCPAPVANLTIT